MFEVSAKNFYLLYFYIFLLRVVSNMSDLKELSYLQKYNGKEYSLWKFQAQAFLNGRGFMRIVDGT